MVPAESSIDASHTETLLVTDASSEAPDDAFPARRGVLRWLDSIGIAAVVVVGLLVRFHTTSPMWLDEALTVNIAKLPLGEIPGALRHDGHPPLYYFLLHGWMKVFGSSDAAIRALAGVFGAATLPLLWVAARRLGGRAAAWTALLLLTLTPYAVRYSTESRMYSLMMVWALAAWLLGQQALRRPTWRNLGGLTLVTAGMLWTHYWALWFGGAAACAMAVRWWRSRQDGKAGDAAASAKVMGALAGGFVLFIPWLPALLYQGAHTGTPWARRSWPTTMIAVSVQDLGGGGKADAQLFGWFMVFAALIGILGAAIDRRRILLDLRGRRATRQAAVLILGTLVIAAIVGAVTNSAFQARYNAVWVPLWVILAGCGLAQLRGPVLRRVVLVVILAVAVPGVVRSVNEPRTQAADAAAVIKRDARPGDAVVVCPDQLGPSLLRAMDHAGMRVAGDPGTTSSDALNVVGYPGYQRPDRIDWVDYEAAVHRVDPRAYARAISARYAGHRVFVAWDGTYRTHTKLCERFSQELAALRGGSTATLTNSGKIYEHEWVVRYGAHPVS